MYTKLYHADNWCFDGLEIFRTVQRGELIISIRITALCTHWLLERSLYSERSIMVSLKWLNSTQWIWYRDARLDHDMIINTQQSTAATICLHFCRHRMVAIPNTAVYCICKKYYCNSLKYIPSCGLCNQTPHCRSNNSSLDTFFKSKFSEIYLYPSPLIIERKIVYIVQVLFRRYQCVMLASKNIANISEKRTWSSGFVLL